MKLHWGHGIAISFILFIGFIGYYTIKIQTAPELEHSLVIENYYAEELNTEALLSSLKNGKPWGDIIQIEQLHKNILIFNLPKVQSIQLEGYRPSDKEADFMLVFKNVSDSIRLDRHYLLQGKWNIILKWQLESKEYRVEKELYIN